MGWIRSFWLARFSQPAAERVVYRHVLRSRPTRILEIGLGLLVRTERLLGALQQHITAHPFLLGERPGRGDFGIFGQLRQLVGWDPVSARLAVSTAPRVVHWVERLDDLSWWDVEGDAGWVDRDHVPSTSVELLAEVGRTYVPFMLANAAAFDAGQEEMHCVIDGLDYRQGTFPYQHKCLRWLRDEYAALSPADRSSVDALLAGTGCELLFA